MDALHLISGFLGLLLAGQALRARKRELQPQWWALTVFGSTHAALSWLLLARQLFPHLALPHPIILSLQALSFLALLAFGALALVRTRRTLISRHDLFFIFWLLLLFIACAWGWRENRWAGLETVFRLTLALPGGILASLSLLLGLGKAGWLRRIASALGALGWLGFALVSGLASPTPTLLSLPLAQDPPHPETLAWLTSLALGLAWLGLLLRDWQAARSVGGERLAFVWMQPTFLSLAIALGLVLARWETDSHFDTLKRQLETLAFQYQNAIATQSFNFPDGGPAFEAAIAAHLRRVEPIVGPRLIYLITRHENEITFGPGFGHGSTAKRPKVADFFATDRDRALFETGEPYLAGPGDHGGRFLTAVWPVRHPANGPSNLALGIDIGSREWNRVQTEASRVPLLCSLVLGLLCLATFSRSLRATTVARFPRLPVEGIAVASFGLVLTAAGAWLVADRLQIDQTKDLQQTTTSLARALTEQIDRTRADLETIARRMNGPPPSGERFLAAWQSTAVDLLHPTWFLLAPDGSVTAVASAPGGSLTLVQPGDKLPLTPENIAPVTAVNLPDIGQAFLLALPSHPGWWVGAVCQPSVMLQRAHRNLGPSQRDLRTALFNLDSGHLVPLASPGELSSFEPPRNAMAPVFFASQTWAVAASLQGSRFLLPPAVAIALLAGTVITGMTLLVVLYLKRRQRDLEADVSERTTELRSREAEARELYERMQRIASQVPGVVFQLKRAPDGSFSFLYLSEAARSAFGLPVHHLLARASHVFDCLTPADRTKFLNALEESARDMIPWREEFRLVQPGGPELWFEGSAIPQRLPDTSVVWSGVFYEVTERKQHEGELLFRANFQQLLTEMAGSFLVSGTDNLDETFHHLLERVGTFVGADRAYLFTLNHSKQTATNTHEWCAPGIRAEKDSLQNVPFDQIPEVIESQTAGRQFLVPDVSSLQPSPLKTILESQEIKSLILLPLMEEHHCFGFAGFDAVRSSRNWREHEISLLQVMASMVTQMILRRKNELALRESEDQLRRNWEFTRTLLNAIPTPVFYMDRDGRFTGCNRSYLDFTGLTVETFAGKTVFDLFDLDLAEEQHAKDLELLRTGERQSYEGTMPDMLGRKREVVFNRDVFRNEKGEITGIVGSFIDISRVRKAEQEQRDMERQLLHSQKLESLGVLAGGVAHDFNNILLAITGNLELARLDLPEDAPARQALDDAFLATSRAVDLTRQMLAYSGKGHFIIQDIDLNRLISENLAIFKAAVAKNVAFDYELAPDLPPIRGDLGQIQQIIMNLITNGSEAVGNKPGTVRVTSYTAKFTAGDLAACRGDVIPEPGTFVVLQVSDTGAGMDSATLSRIFEPFFSTKFTGRGLGMAAVLGILRGHNGGIFIDSRPAEGTRVRILFPAVRTDSTAPAPTTASPTRDGRTLHGRLLLADDEADVRQVCTRLLERLGLEVHAVSDGMEAVLAVEAQPFAFDLALLDLTMPNMDGLATLAYLSKHYPKLPVILISGYSREEVIAGGDADACAGFIQKPFRLDLLQAEITRVLTSGRIRH